jgi:hypothetical protein
LVEPLNHPHSPTGGIVAGRGNDPPMSDDLKALLLKNADNPDAMEFLFRDALVYLEKYEADIAALHLEVDALRSQAAPVDPRNLSEMSLTVIRASLIRDRQRAFSEMSKWRPNSSIAKMFTDEIAEIDAALSELDPSK